MRDAFHALTTLLRRIAMVLRILLLSLSFTSVAGVAAASPFFVGLGDLPGGIFDSRANAVSADGSTVAGESDSKPVAFHDGGVEELPWAATTSRGAAWDVSADGSVVVGGRNGQAVRWDNGVPTALGGLPGGTPFGAARGVSSNGGVVVGETVMEQVELCCDVDDNPYFVDRRQAFRVQGGVMAGLGYLPGDDDSVAWGVSADGGVVVGHSSRVDAAGFEAFRWEGGAMVGLGVPDSIAWGVSADGTAVVGQVAVSGGVEAFVWSGATLTLLGELPGGQHRSIAWDASTGGAFVVGQSHSASAIEAVIWDANGTLHVLADYLVDRYGLGEALAGWHLGAARGISPDGRYITGYGTNPAGQVEAFLVLVPEPATALQLGLAVLALAVRRRRIRG